MLTTKFLRSALACTLFVFCIVMGSTTSSMAQASGANTSSKEAQYKRYNAADAGGSGTIQSLGGFSDTANASAMLLDDGCQYDGYPCDTGSANGQLETPKDSIGLGDTQGQKIQASNVK